MKNFTIVYSKLDDLVWLTVYNCKTKNTSNGYINASEVKADVDTNTFNLYKCNLLPEALNVHVQEFETQEDAVEMMINDENFKMLIKLAEGEDNEIINR